ncbi:MAG: hypothetical protein ABL996_05735 [Micropepsaceae bacterium]
MHGSRTGLIVLIVFTCVFGASYGYLQYRGYLMTTPLSAELDAVGESTAVKPPPPPAPIVEPTPEELAAIELGAGVPSGETPMDSGATSALDMTPPGYPPAAHDPEPTPSALPPAAAADPPAVKPAAPKPARKNGESGSKVLSYFQHTRTQVDTSRAFGFVLLPRIAVTSDERDVQKRFCEIMLATMDFMTPGAVAAARSEVLATYWPIVASRQSFEIKAAFAARDCGLLITWYDHKIARSLAAKAGVAHLSGPLLITWPSMGTEGEQARNPMIVDFSKADHERATKALQYWFRQLRAKPELWTNRIREGTIRAELADAVNDTAGVVLAVLNRKWDSLTVVASAAP